MIFFIDRIQSYNNLNDKRKNNLNLALINYLFSLSFDVKILIN